MPESVLTTEYFVEEPVVLEKLAPDFTVPAYHQGKSSTIKLSDFRNKWVVLFFYANDFSFV